MLSQYASQSAVVAFIPITDGNVATASLLSHADDGGDDMELMTDEIRKSLPPLYSTENDTNPLLRLKFFTPDANWTWYAIEFDGDDLFFGLVIGLETELGYFRLSELQEVRGPLKLPIERDLYFNPVPLSTVHQMRRVE